MGDLIKKDLVILEGHLPDSASRRRRLEVERRLLQSSSHADGPDVRRPNLQRPRLSVHTQHLAWANLFNGDVRKLRIEHYENGCCRNRAHTVEKMVEFGVRRLFPTPCKWSRKSWVGRQDAAAAVAISEAVHNLLSRAVAAAHMTGTTRAGSAPR